MEEVVRHKYKLMVAVWRTKTVISKSHLEIGKFFVEIVAYIP